MDVLESDIFYLIRSRKSMVYSLLTTEMTSLRNFVVSLPTSRDRGKRGRAQNLLNGKDSILEKIRLTNKNQNHTLSSVGRHGVHPFDEHCGSGRNGQGRFPFTM